MPPLNLYARVRFSLCNLAHETAGAARTRHSLLPPFGRERNVSKARALSRRENAKSHLLFENCMQNFFSSLRGAIATKQSIVPHVGRNGLLRFGRNNGWNRRVGKAQRAHHFERSVGGGHGAGAFAHPCNNAIGYCLGIPRGMACHGWPSMAGRWRSDRTHPEQFVAAP